MWATRTTRAWTQGSAVAGRDLFLVLWRSDAQVAVPFDRSPPLTVIVGFLGAKRLYLLVIMKGNVDTPLPLPAFRLRHGGVAGTLLNGQGQRLGRRALLQLQR